MKKLLLLLIAVLSAAGVYAQVEDANRVVLHSKDGKTTVYNFADLDYMEFDKIGEVSVELSLVEGSVTETSLSVKAVPSDDCASYTISYNVPGKPVNELGSMSGEQTVEITGLSAGTPVYVNAVPSDKYGIAAEPVQIYAYTSGEAPYADPKVGDYFYSDGTWSDGGLISIDLDGRNAVWAENKPEPLPGKKVVGIVCINDPNRIAPADKAAGYTHGYVIGCKNVTDKGKFNYNLYPETVWYGAPSQEIEVVQVCRIGSSCYNAITGRQDTQDMLAAFNDPSYSCPLFYYSSTGYPVDAPESTSGWFVPAMGQLWDCIANFCSGKVADYLYGLRSFSSDVTFEGGTNTEVNNLEKFMSVFEKVPAADKDEITMSDREVAPTYVSLRSSTRYSTEAAIHFNLGNDNTGFIEAMAGWFDEEGHARPMLAF